MTNKIKKLYDDEMLKVFKLKDHYAAKLSENFKTFLAKFDEVSKMEDLYPSPQVYSNKAFSKFFNGGYKSGKFIDDYNKLEVTSIFDKAQLNGSDNSFYKIEQRGNKIGVLVNKKAAFTFLSLAQLKVRVNKDVMGRYLADKLDDLDLYNDKELFVPIATISKDVLARCKKTGMTPLPIYFPETMNEVDLGKYLSADDKYELTDFSSTENRTKLQEAFKKSYAEIGYDIYFVDKVEDSIINIAKLNPTKRQSNIGGFCIPMAAYAGDSIPIVLNLNYGIRSSISSGIHEIGHAIGYGHIFMNAFDISSYFAKTSVGADNMGYNELMKLENQNLRVDLQAMERARMGKVFDQYKKPVTEFLVQPSENADDLIELKRDDSHKDKTTVTLSGSVESFTLSNPSTDGDQTIINCRGIVSRLNRKGYASGVTAKLAPSGKITFKTNNKSGYFDDASLTIGYWTKLAEFVGSNDTDIVEVIDCGDITYKNITVRTGKGAKDTYRLVSGTIVVDETDAQCHKVFSFKEDSVVNFSTFTKDELTQKTVNGDLFLTSKDGQCVYQIENFSKEKISLTFSEKAVSKTDIKEGNTSNFLPFDASKAESIAPKVTVKEGVGDFDANFEFKNAVIFSYDYNTKKVMKFSSEQLYSKSERRRWTSSYAFGLGVQMIRTPNNGMFMSLDKIRVKDEEFGIIKGMYLRSFFNDTGSLRSDDVDTGGRSQVFEYNKIFSFGVSPKHDYALTERKNDLIVKDITRNVSLTFHSSAFTSGERDFSKLFEIRNNAVIGANHDFEVILRDHTPGGLSIVDNKGKAHELLKGTASKSGLIHGLSFKGQAKTDRPDLVSVSLRTANHGDNQWMTAYFEVK